MEILVKDVERGSFLCAFKPISESKKKIYFQLSNFNFEKIFEFVFSLSMFCKKLIFNFFFFFSFSIIKVNFGKKNEN